MEQDKSIPSLITRNQLLKIGLNFYCRTKRLYYANQSSSAEDKIHMYYSVNRRLEVAPLYRFTVWSFGIVELFTIYIYIVVHFLNCVRVITYSVRAVRA